MDAINAIDDFLNNEQNDLARMDIDGAAAVPQQGDHGAAARPVAPNVDGVAPPAPQAPVAAAGLGAPYVNAPIPPAPQARAAAARRVAPAYFNGAIPPPPQVPAAAAGRYAPAPPVDGPLDGPVGAIQPLEDAAGPAAVAGHAGPANRGGHRFFPYRGVRAGRAVQGRRRCRQILKVMIEVAKESFGDEDPNAPDTDN